jgi:hypothetical protein
MGLWFAARRQWVEAAALHAEEPSLDKLNSHDVRFA